MTPRNAISVSLTTLPSIQIPLHSSTNTLHPTPHLPTSPHIHPKPNIQPPTQRSYPRPIPLLSGVTPDAKVPYPGSSPDPIIPPAVTHGTLISPSWPDRPSATPLPNHAADTTPYQLYIAESYLWLLLLIPFWVFGVWKLDFLYFPEVASVPMCMLLSWLRLESYFSTGVCSGTIGLSSLQFYCEKLIWAWIAFLVLRLVITR